MQPLPAIVSQAICTPPPEPPPEAWALAMPPLARMTPSIVARPEGQRMLTGPPPLPPYT